MIVCRLAVGMMQSQTASLTAARSQRRISIWVVEPTLGYTGLVEQCSLE